jgi:hypothetical protein
MGRLRTIFVMRGVLAAFFVVLGIVLLATGNLVFGLFAIAVAVVNAGLIVVLARKARGAG